MEPQAIINLLDTYWYHLDFFNGESKTILKIPEIPSSDTEIPVLPTIQTKTKNQPNTSDQQSFSPDSVLLNPSKLQTIFSGKESSDVEVSRVEKEFHEDHSNNTKTCSPLKGKNNKQLRRRKNKGLSKSLSDLEFEEVKGFMDLGFVFSEEDKDSNLGSLIPGLQRIGRKMNDNNSVDEVKKVEDKMVISRPYLSEAWEILEKKRKENNNNSLVIWKVPTLDNEIYMKDYLRFWAHSVAKASSVN